MNSASPASCPAVRRRPRRKRARVPWRACPNTATTSSNWSLWRSRKPAPCPGPGRALRVRVAVTEALAGAPGPGRAVSGAGPLVEGCRPDEDQNAPSWRLDQVVSDIHLTHPPGVGWSPAGDPSVAPDWPEPLPLAEFAAAAGIDLEAVGGDSAATARTIAEAAKSPAFARASATTRALLRTRPDGGRELKLHSSYPYGDVYDFTAAHAVPGWARRRPRRGLARALQSQRLPARERAQRHPRRGAGADGRGRRRRPPRTLGLRLVDGCAGRGVPRTRGGGRRRALARRTGHGTAAARRGLARPPERAPVLERTPLGRGRRRRIRTAGLRGRAEARRAGHRPRARPAGRRNPRTDGRGGRPASAALVRGRGRGGRRLVGKSDLRGRGHGPRSGKVFPPRTRSAAVGAHRPTGRAPRKSQGGCGCGRPCRTARDPGVGWPAQAVFAAGFGATRARGAHEENSR